MNDVKLGENHPDGTHSLNNLANLYSEQGRNVAAEALYQCALSIMKVEFPGGHPNLDIFQKNYDELKRKQAGQ
ncbi:tetratricopeptide repeat protein [Candidatus Electronema sp. PJ]|uniref:tetratricopeptide repeat protein n=1 Tax=Candidatus Electronema sp. PJ TaxID=3401572 RepID=UPI003AA971C0